MKSNMLLMGLLALIISACTPNRLVVNGEKGSDVLIRQGKAPVSVSGDTIRLKPQPFDILSRYSILNICLSDRRENLANVKAGIDTVKDFSSCFNIAKFFAMDENADYLILDGDGANSLNDAHGMKRIPNGPFIFKVKKIYDAKKEKDLEVAQVKGPLYAAFWIDKSGDRIIDGGEYRIFTLLFE